MFNSRLVAKLYPDGEAPELITHVDAEGKGISQVESLAGFKQLLRLNLASNQLAEFGGLAASTTLKQLLLTGNSIGKISRLDIPELQVLNLADNQLSGTIKIRGLPKLRALILSNNAITNVKGLGRLPDLNTVVVKDNSITELGDMLRGCTALEKLSMAHNEVADLSEALAGLAMLQELRLGHNELTRLPEELAANTRLKIVDLSGCPVKQLSDIQVLASLPLLQQLSLKGTPLAAGDAARDRVLEMLPLVEVLDGKRVRPRIRGRLTRHQEATGIGAGAPPAVTKNAASASRETARGAQAAVAAAAGAHGGAGGTAASDGGVGGASGPVAGRNGMAAPAAGAPGGRAALGPQSKRRDPRLHEGADAAAVRASRQQGAAPIATDSDDEEAVPADGARSFLDEVFTPETVASVEPAVGRAKAQKGAQGSGVVAIVPADSARSQKRTRRAKRGKAAAEAAEGAADAEAAASEASHGAAALLTGSSVAQLLQSDAGVAVLPAIGAGGRSAWDEPAEAVFGISSANDPADPDLDGARKQLRSADGETVTGSGNMARKNKSAKRKGSADAAHAGKVGKKGKVDRTNSGKH